MPTKSKKATTPAAAPKGVKTVARSPAGSPSLGLKGGGGKRREPSPTSTGVLGEVAPAVAEYAQSA